MMRATARRCSGCPFQVPPRGPFPRNPAFSLPEYPPFKEAPAEAQHGVLGLLEGVWENVDGVYGAHTTVLPAPGSTSEQLFGTFHYKSQKYTEKLQFSKNPNPVRNRLGSNEQFNGAVLYKTKVSDRTNAVIHFEDGMYLWLGLWGQQGSAPYSNPEMLFSRKATIDDVERNNTNAVLQPGQQGPQFVPPYTISRQGSIPHGNAVQLMGNQPVDSNGNVMVDIQGAPQFWKGDALWDQSSLAIDPTMGFVASELISEGATYTQPPAWTQWPIGDSPPPENAEVLDPNSGKAYVKQCFTVKEPIKQGDGTIVEEYMYPYCIQPNIILKQANEGVNIQSHNMFTLSTHHDTGLQGGSLNNVGVDRYARVVQMDLSMWISKVQLDCGKLVDQLQYEQKVFFEFQFGSNGGKTRWPHIQVNTLRRTDEAPTI